MVDAILLSQPAAQHQRMLGISPCILVEIPEDVRDRISWGIGIGQFIEPEYRGVALSIQRHSVIQPGCAQTLLEQWIWHERPEVWDRPSPRRRCQA